MKNLKRVLSLSLASVMLLGMMVVGASAKDFTDAEEIDHPDAVQTLVALNIIKGKEDGSYFDPKGTVTRGEMAKMIAVAMNGGNEEAPGVKMTPTFTDISGHWAEPFIEYCADMGIISGRGDGTFDPNGNVTGLEATKMVLTALGYDDEAYQLTGATWAVRTYEVAKTAKPKGLFEELDTVSMNADATRDTAAQVIWNGLLSYVVTVNPVADKASTGLEWQYGVDTSTRLLKQRYNANAEEGTYMGNSKSINTLDDGFIRVRIGTTDHDFPCDLGIENIGEEVRIVWKDGTRGTTGVADRNDTIYGCFNTGRTTVYNITKDDIQDAGSDKSSKIKFGGSLHEVKAGGMRVVTNYVESSATTVTSTQFNAAPWRTTQLIDEIKLVTDPDDGKISSAYVTTIGAGKVSSVTSSKVTITGLGTIEIDDNDVYEDIAKDDVVFFTRFYNNSDVDKAFVTVKKAEVVEGSLTGYKLDSGKIVNVVVDGDTYKTNGKVPSLANITDDSITTITDKNIGDEVAAYLANGKVVALQQIDNKGGKYALVTDASINSSATPGAAIDGMKVRVLLPDGTESVLNVHKDSTKDNRASSAALITAAGDVAIGDLIEYSTLSSSTIKIKSLAKDGNNSKTVGYTNASVGSGATSAAPVTLWDKDKKTVRFNNGSGETTMVAATDAVLFVARDTAGSSGTVDAADEFKAYSIRDLGTINVEAATKVEVYVKDGLVQAAYFVLADKPKTTGTNTYYGIVKSWVGYRTDGDDTTYAQYNVSVNGGEEIVINVEGSDHTAAGMPSEKDVITFEERNDGYYTKGDIKLLLDKDNALHPDAQLVAVDKYNESAKLLTFFCSTERGSATAAFEGNVGGSYTVDKDAKIICINADDKKVMDYEDVDAFKTDTGYANAIITLDDGLVDAIIVETSNEVNWAAGTDVAANFGKVDTETLTGVANVTASAGSYGAYTVAASTTTPEVGAAFTITVTCGSVDGANTNGEKVTVTYNSVTQTHVFTAAGQSHTFSFTCADGQTTVAVSAAANT